MITSLFVLAVLGFCISLYTYLLEKKVKKDPNYKPVCDISDKISCTKPMKSSYAALFYFSNAVIGMIFYAVIALLAFFEMHKLIALLAIAGFIASCILAYVLYSRIKSLCLLCTALYGINILILYVALKGF
jgi:vitamin-K-epoxide reductase (warfarin-sensitive)